MPSQVGAVTRVRAIPELTRLLLAVRAGGRCEFDGHNKYLFRHTPTLTKGNFSQAAHIVAFKKDGPRGRHRSRVDERAIHNVDNLMLLCSDCHKLIDDRPEEYSVGVLRAYKAKHERRIEHVTSLKPDSLTTVVVLQGDVAGQRFTLPPGQIHEALAPRYPKHEDPFVIDLSSITDEGDGAYLTTATRTIDRELAKLYADCLRGPGVDHISIFAIASIPVLIHFGAQLSDKVRTDLYQRHRGSEEWRWRSRGAPARYGFTALREGTPSGEVALLLALSGPIDLPSLPETIGQDSSIYELRLASSMPNPQFLRRRADLHEFEHEYQLALRTIAKERPGLGRIHLFPAVPAPVAVTCGRALMRPDPPLLVYDFRRGRGYIPTITVTKESK